MKKDDIQRRKFIEDLVGLKKPSSVEASNENFELLRTLENLPASEKLANPDRVYRLGGINKKSSALSRLGRMP